MSKGLRKSTKENSEAVKNYKKANQPQLKQKPQTKQKIIPQSNTSKKASYYRFNHLKSKSISVTSSQSQSRQGMIDNQQSEEDDYGQSKRIKVVDRADITSSQSEDEEKNLFLVSPFKGQSSKTAQMLANQKKYQLSSNRQRHHVQQEVKKSSKKSKIENGHTKSQDRQNPIHKRNQSTRQDKKEHRKNKQSIYETSVPNRSNSITQLTLQHELNKKKVKNQIIFTHREETENIVKRGESKCSKHDHVLNDGQHSTRSRKKCKRCNSKKSRQNDDESESQGSATRSQKSSRSFGGVMALKKLCFQEQDLDIDEANFQDQRDGQKIMQGPRELTPTRLNQELNKILETEKKIKEYKEMITKLQREFYSKKPQNSKQGNSVQKKVFQEDLTSSLSFNNSNILSAQQQLGVFGEICSRNPQKDFAKISKTLSQETDKTFQPFRDVTVVTQQTQINNQQVEIKEVPEDPHDEDEESILQQTQQMQVMTQQTNPHHILQHQNDHNITPLYIEKTIIPEEEEITQLNGQNEEEQEEAILNFYQEFKRDEDSITPTLSSERGNFFQSIVRPTSSISKDEILSPLISEYFQQQQLQNLQQNLQGNNQGIQLQKNNQINDEEQIPCQDGYLENFIDHQQPTFQSTQRPSIGQFMKSQCRNSITPIKNSYAQIYKKQIQQLKNSKGLSSTSYISSLLSKSNNKSSIKNDKSLTNQAQHHLSVQTANSQTRTLAHTIMGLTTPNNIGKTSSSIVDRYLNSNCKSKNSNLPQAQSIVLSSSPPKTTKASVKHLSNYFSKNTQDSQSIGSSSIIKSSKNSQGVKCQTIDLTALLTKTRQQATISHTSYQLQSSSLTRNQNTFNTACSSNGSQNKGTYHSSQHSFQSILTSTPMTKVNLKKY